MKKLFLVLAAAFAMVACQTDINEVGVVAGGEVDVTFEVGTPTRAYSDGTTATVLQYAVYEVVDKDNEGTAEILTPLTVTNGEIHGSTTVKLQLVTGNTYAVVFWAAAPNAPYTVDFGSTLGEAKMTVNYTNAACNDENRDAFFKKHVFTVKGAQTETIELRRPFAQLNIGTNDYDASANAGYTPNQSYVKVTSIYDTLNLWNGTVSGETAVEFAYADIKRDETFPVAGHEYLAMNYLLVNEKETVDVEFAYKETSTGDAKTRTVGSVPVQRNYRTNIYGQLLTSDVDINVEINPEYEQPNYNQEWATPWSGEADTTWYKETDSNGNPITEFIIVTPEQLAGLTELVDGGNTFEGKTIKLGINLDLLKIGDNGEPVCFDPIGSYRHDKIFKGTFDGQDHIIMNMSQNTWALDNGYYYNDCGMGLFAAAQDATIKNIKMDKANISGESGLCGIIAAVAKNVTFENITVTNSKCADYQYYAGGIAGWVSGDNNKFINCNVDASTTIGGQWGDFANANGGVIGGTSGSAKIHMENCNVACQIDAHNDVVSTYQWYIYRRCGMLIGDTGAIKAVDGRNYADAPQLTCKNVTVTYGEWANYTYCQFSAMGQYPWVRVQAGISCEAYSNIRYGHPTDANGNTVVDDNHVHNDGEGHHVLIVFDQLLGGGPNGDGRNPVYGTQAFEGVTVNYHASYVRGVSSLADISKAADLGIKQVALEADLDAGTTQLALNGLQVDLGGHTLTTNMTHGGIALKNGASIKNGTIEHTNTVAAIKAFNVGSIENVTIKNTCATAGKTVTGIAIQNGGHVGSIKNVKFEGVSQAIEVGYQATVDLIEDVEVYGKDNGTAQGIGLVINGGKVGKAINSTFKGDSYGVKMLLKGVFAVGLELEGCTVEGATASIAAYDEKGISNTSGSLVLTYDAATTLTGPFVWDFEDECKSVVTLNHP